MINNRSSGVLCHIASLPSDYGIGDLGPKTYAFIDSLCCAGQAWWQVLPLSPTDNALGNSPYSSFSAFAFNPLFISPEQLVNDGFLSLTDISPFMCDASDKIVYDQVYSNKQSLVDLAFSRYGQRRFPLKRFEDFCFNQASWLEDFAFFVVIKRMFANVSWIDWPVGFRDRDPVVLEQLRKHRNTEIRKEKFTQYLFYSQWMALQQYCSAKGVGIIGDIPIYVNYDSVDVWRNPELFKLDASKRQTVVAGVPPDYFSKDGQRWGNPVYDWNALRSSGFSWWIKRIRHNLTLFDSIRIDHFRAFAQCWEIPVKEKTAVNGAWCDVPGMEFFSVVRKSFDRLPVIAEDLGIITPDVDALKEHFGFPGMRVIMFAFHNEYKKSRDLPENHTVDSVVYTGTHDNNTVYGWFDHDMTGLEKKNFLEYSAVGLVRRDVNWTMIRLAMRSVAALCIIPVQDLVGLGEEARMNNPSTLKDNWKWRLMDGALDSEILARLSQLTQEFRRSADA